MEDFNSIKSQIVKELNSKKLSDVLPSIIDFAQRTGSIALKQLCVYGAQNEAYKMMESRKVGKVVSLQRVMRGLMVEAPQNETFTLV